MLIRAGRRRSTPRDCAVHVQQQARSSGSIIYMKNSLVPLCICIVTLSAHLLHAQEGMRYREFQLGSDVASVGKLIGTAASDVKLIHQRPVVMQDLEWRPRYFSRGALAQTDPVELIVFRFYDDQLFRVVVDYDRERTKGMTEADMIAAMTAEDGPASRRYRQHRIVSRRSTTARPMRLSRSGEIRIRPSHCCAWPIRYRSGSSSP